MEDKKYSISYYIDYHKKIVNLQLWSVGVSGVSKFKNAKKKKRIPQAFKLKQSFIVQHLFSDIVLIILPFPQGVKQYFFLPYNSLTKLCTKEI